MSRYLNGCRERKRERVKQLLFLRILYRNCIVTNSLNNNKQFDPSASYTQLLILCIILLSFLRSYNNYPFDKNLDDIINSLSRIQISQKKKKKKKLQSILQRNARQNPARSTELVSKEELVSSPRLSQS